MIRRPDTFGNSLVGDVIKTRILCVAVILLVVVDIVRSVDCPRELKYPPISCVRKQHCSESDSGLMPCDEHDLNFVLCPNNKITIPTNISDTKCAAYAKMVKTCEIEPVLSTGPTRYYEQDHCVSSEPLVAGGMPAEPKQYPFMVLIGYGKGPYVWWKCGGTLISPKWILSAAHCSFHSELGIARWARLGEIDVKIEDDDTVPQTIRIKQRKSHHGYDERMRYHDIALYLLVKEAEITPFVRPACLHTSLVDPAASHGLVLGWGANLTEKDQSHLQVAKIPLLSGEQCNTRFSRISLPSTKFPNGLQWDKMMCAGGEIGRDTCAGDSGGPIAVKSGLYCTLSIVGVTSFSLNDCGTDSPGIYTRIQYYMPWISSVVWPDAESP